MKRLNKTESPIFVDVFFASKGNLRLLTFHVHFLLCQALFSVKSTNKLAPPRRDPGATLAQNRQFKPG